MSYTLNIEPDIVNKAESFAARKGTTVDAMIRACLLVFVSQVTVNDGGSSLAQQDVAPLSRTLEIGSMKDEITLPDNFDEAFDALDQDVASMFNGCVS